MKKRLVTLLLSAALLSLCLVGCGGIMKSNDDYNASHHVTFKAAYAISDSNSEVAELWVFSTVNADEKENLYGVHYQNASKGGQIGTTAPYAKFDENNIYTDKYFLNKSKYDSYFGGTPYGCWSDMQPLYAGTNDKAYLVMVFNVGKNDLENCEEVAVNNVNYNFKLNVSDIQAAGSVEEVASHAVELQQVFRENSEGLLSLLNQHYNGAYKPGELREEADKKDEAAAKIAETADGMTKSEVLNGAWGEPDERNVDEYAWGTSEQWVYDDHGYVYFENGIVNAIQHR